MLGISSKGAFAVARGQWDFELGWLDGLDQICDQRNEQQPEKSGHIPDEVVEQRAEASGKSRAPKGDEGACGFGRGATKDGGYCQ